MVLFLSVPLITNTHKNILVKHTQTLLVYVSRKLWSRLTKRKDGVHREDSQTGQSGRSPFTGINRALLRLIPDVCLCVLPALCALRGERECVWPRFDQNTSEQDKQTDQHCTCFMTKGNWLKQQTWHLMLLTEIQKKKRTKHQQKSSVDYPMAHTQLESVAAAFMHTPSFQDKVVFSENCYIHQKIKISGERQLNSWTSHQWYYLC